MAFRRWTSTARVQRAVVPVAIATFVAVLGAAPAAAGGASVRRVVDTSAWHHPSPDPSGIARIGGTDRFVVVDGEVEETGLWRASNVWLTRETLHPSGSWSSVRYTNEPADVAMPSARLVYLADDSTRRIIEIRPGPDLEFGTPDDRAEGFYTETFHGSDPEGIAFGAGALFIVNGEGRSVVRLGRGDDGRFGTEDDDVHRFGTGPLGLREPEGIAFLDGHLFIVSRMDAEIVQTTSSGAFVDRYDISSSGIHHPSGIAVAAGGDGVTAWVTDRGIDNAAGAESDGRIYVFSLAGRTPEPAQPRRVVPHGLDRVLAAVVEGLRDLAGSIAFQ